MRYQGGKSRIAKEIAAVIAPKGPWWDPFCGGLSVSVALAKYGPGIVSDKNEALVNLYKAVRNGWAPPCNVLPDEYQSAKHLPDTDPMKAFCGAGCSFGGKWFAGHAVGHQRENFALTAGKALLRDLPKLSGCLIKQDDFLTSPVLRCFDAVYCDPPYAGTTGYKTGKFDHAAFYARCVEWANVGTRVFVSEYSEPTVPHELVWSKTCTPGMRSKVKHGKAEKLFLIRSQ